jgi:hypothetical protein
MKIRLWMKMPPMRNLHDSNSGRAYEEAREA